MEPVNGNLRAITDVLPLLIPLILIQLGLMAFALYDLVNRERVRGGSKVLWAVIIILVNLIGPIIYFVLGREEE